MGCSKSLDLSPAAPAGAHLSFYWTMDEGGGANKVDSTVGHVWNMIAGSTAEPGLFSNGTQLDCTGALIAPHAHGLSNVADASLAIDSTVSKGIAFWFWFKLITPSSVIGRFIRPYFNFEFYSGGFVSDYLLQVRFDLIPGIGTSGWVLEHQDFNGPTDTQSAGTFDLVLGTWHMFAGTFDLVNHTLKSYLDGVLKDTKPDPLIHNTTTQADLWFQNNYAGIDIGNLFNAVVDELGMCLNGVLTQDQITALWNGGAGVTWPGVNAIVNFP